MSSPSPWMRLAPLLLCAGCAAASPAGAAHHGGDGLPAHGHPHSAPAHEVVGHDTEAALAEVARVHGGAGPWAVAGYRMGEHALRALDLPRGSFDLEVVHHGPKEVQYACIADGAAASTGASLGKLNLSMVEATAAATHTVYRNKATGASLVLRLTPAFIARFRDVPRAELAAAGRQVLALPEAEVFERVPAGPDPSGPGPAATMKP